MPIQRKFLDWQQPILQVAARWLIDHFRSPKQANRSDMRQALVVVPGRRAGRRLLEILVQQCEADQLILSPPQILTEGSFPEQLYLPKKPFANRLTQQLAWAQALAQSPANVQRLVLPHPPKSQDSARWLALGDALRQQHLALAADGHNFADVARKGAQLPGFDEQARWEALAKVQERYHSILDQFQLWDIQSARLYAIEHRELRTEHPIFLLGTVDLNMALRQMLDQVAEHVTALIAAPQQLEDAFDSHGCLQVEFWNERRIPFADDQILSADAPADQAVAAARCLAKWNGKYRADEITIGVADETLVSQVQRQLTEYGVPTRWVAGRKMAETGPWRMLTAAADFVVGRRYDALAALLRHPDIYDYLRQQLRPADDASDPPDFIAACDNYFNEHLPRFVTDQWLGHADNHTIPQQVVHHLDALLRPLAGNNKPLARWCESLRMLLARLYGSRPLQTNLPSDRELLEVGRILETALAALEAVPPKLQTTVSLADALTMILEPLEDESIPPPPDPSAVELLGWLELGMDDAPALIVLSFNEGFVPKSHHADAFLPNRLREHLGLDDNRRRYARDAYTTEAILTSRQQSHWIVGRRDHENNPLAPSRLLFATAEETALARALQFFNKPAAPTLRRSLLTDAPLPQQTPFVVPLPDVADVTRKFDAISVTHFSSYLACPYRFFLEKMLYLQLIDDAARELDAPAFGNLVHEVLQLFGADPAINQSTLAKPIIDFLDERLDQLVQERFGSQRRGVINIQAEQARARLRSFAEWQALRASDGWQIAYTEQIEQQLKVPFAVDKKKITLRGRIDRIDWHPHQKIWQILDYKTGESATDPYRAHCDREGNWRDLQLPLYRHLAAELEPNGLRVHLGTGRVELGYIALPKDSPNIGVKIAPWTEAQLQAADETARQVIRSIWNHEFWPPTEPPPRYGDAFMAICQDNLLDRLRPFSAGSDGADEAGDWGGA